MNAFVSTFDSDKKTLYEVLGDIDEGKVQLPDFQRGWVWDDDHIKSLLASISLSYPVSAVLFLEADGDQRRFLPRPIEGAEVNGVQPDLLILDGQQRLTSLYQTLRMRRVVATQDARGKKLKRWYYVDMKKALDSSVDREEAIVSLPEDRVLRTNFNRDVLLDCSSSELECEHQMFPLYALFDQPALNRWRQLFQMATDPATMMARVNLWNTFESQIVQRFQSYHLPIIRLKKETPADAVAQVFEKVNTGGVSLTVFELVTAMFSGDGFRLREDWYGRSRNMTASPATAPLLRGVQASDFLTGVALLSSFQHYKTGRTSDASAVVKCKRKDVLELQLADYQAVATDLTKGFIMAAEFLVQHKIFQWRDVPYTTQLIPLAAILVALGNRADLDSVRQKVAQWYWCGVFGELYSSSTETRFAKDLPEVVAWAESGGPVPTTVTDATFAADRLLRLRTRNSAAYKGVSALLMSAGGLDFRTGKSIEVSTFFDSSLDIHHIFPQAWCKRQNIGAARYNCIVNKTPLSSKTNRIIGGSAPSVYLGKLEQTTQLSRERLDEILLTHYISPPQLWGDDFNGFFNQRSAQLLTLIERAMGKPVMREVSGTVSVTEEDELEEEHEDTWNV